MDSKVYKSDLQADDNKHLTSLITGGNLTGVADFLRQKCVSVNTRLISSSAERTYPLHVAINVKPEVYNHDLVKYFISDGADCNIHDSTGYAPLHYAAITNNIAAATTLAEAGANVSLQTNLPFQPLREATFFCIPKRERKQIIRKRKAQLQSFPLHMSIKPRGDDENDPVAENNREHGTSTIKLVQLFLSYGANCNQYDGSGFTPLHYAVMTNDIGIAHVLLDGGADINIHTQEESLETPLFLAKDLVMVKFLLSKNADPEITCKAGKNLIDWSIIKNRHDITSFLVTDMPVLLHSKSGGVLSPLAFILTRFINSIYYQDVHMNTKEDVEDATHVVYRMIRAGYDPTPEVHRFKNRALQSCFLEKKPAYQKLLKTMEEIASNPRRLFDLCTVRIRSSLRRNVTKAVDSLPLPVKLRETLMLPQSSCSFPIENPNLLQE